MKFKAGRILAKVSTPGGLHYQYAFLKIWHDERGEWWCKFEDQDQKYIDNEIKEMLINDLYLVKELQPSEKPKFTNVRVTITAESIQGGEHSWTRMNGPALEKLVKTFPELVEEYWPDQNRKRKIFEYLKKKHHKTGGKY